MKIAAALLPLLALGLAPSYGAAAAPHAGAIAAPDPQSLIDANVQLTARIKATAPGKPLPSLDNDGAALVRVAYDAETIRTAPLDDAGVIGGMCEAIGNSMVAYGTAMEQEAHGDSAALQTETVRLQNEFSLATAAANICVQRAFRSVDSVIATLSPEVIGNIAPALQMMRTGTAMTIEGTIALLEMEGYTPANQELMVTAMAEDSAVVAASFPAAERQKLATMVRDAAGRARPGLKPALERLARSFAANDCNNICKAAGG